MSQIVQIGLIQTHADEAVERNLERTLALCHKAADAGANIICTQELYRSQYLCHVEDANLFDLAETIPGPSTEAFARLAKERGVVIVASLFEKRAAGLYHNTAVVMDADGTLLGKYRKMHIPDDPGYYEKFYFTPGDLGFKAFQTRYGKIGVLVCWDQWYPEAARLTAMSGAEILFYPTAIGWSEAEKDSNVKVCQHKAWDTIQVSHAIANGVFVASVNRIGVEHGMKFWGGSFVCDPFGERLAQASHDKEEVIIVPCDLAEVEKTRRHWPFLRDRRIDAYDGIDQRYLQ